MEQSDTLLLLSLNVTEMRTLLALRHLADPKGKVKVTMEELGILTKYSRESTRVALRGLEARGLVDTHRTKRNLGRLYKNEYQLVQENLASDDDATKNLPVEVPEILASTADISNTSNTDNVLVKDTSYLLAAWGRTEQFKEVKVVNRWKDDDDDVAGFGLLDSDIEKKQAPKKVSKKRPVNRMLRPEAEWTPQDVATEFAMMLYQNCKAHSGPVDSNKLRAILAGNRNRYKLTATTELEVLRRMFYDDEAVRSIQKSPENGYKIYLNWLMAHVNQTANGTVAIDESAPEEYVYASDGKTFDNSVPGRIDLKEYEATLRRV